MHVSDSEHKSFETRKMSTSGNRNFLLNSHFDIYTTILWKFHSCKTTHILMFLRSIFQEISLTNTPKWSKFYGIATPSRLSITHIWWGCKGAGRSKNLFICNFLAAPQISTQNLGILQLIKCSKRWVLMLLKFVELDFYLPIYSIYSWFDKILTGMPFKLHLLYEEM